MSTASSIACNIWDIFTPNCLVFLSWNSNLIEHSEFFFARFGNPRWEPGEQNLVAFYWSSCKVVLGHMRTRCRRQVFEDKQRTEAECSGSGPEWLRSGQWNQQTREESQLCSENRVCVCVCVCVSGGGGWCFRLSNKAHNIVLLSRVVVRIKHGYLGCAWHSAWHVGSSTNRLV